MKLGAIQISPLNQKRQTDRKLERVGGGGGGEGEKKDKKKLLIIKKKSLGILKSTKCAMTIYLHTFNL